MHSSRMPLPTHWLYLVVSSTHTPCHAHPLPHTHPCHAHPLPCMPPMHTPATHIPLPCMPPPPAMDAPLPHMPPYHACPLPCMPLHHTHTHIPTMHAPHHTCPSSMHTPPPHMPPPCEQNSWHTLLKILPCPNFVAGGKKRSVIRTKKVVL